MLDNCPEACAFGPDDRRVPDHCHLFLDASNLEMEIDTRLLTRRQTDALAAHGPEPRELDLEAVVARCQAGHRVHAITGGNNHPLQILPCFGGGDRRAGNGGPSLIFHKTGDCAGSRLRAGGHHRDAADARNGQPN